MILIEQWTVVVSEVPSGGVVWYGMLHNLKVLNLWHVTILFGHY